jgi:hypothetical protein
MPKFLSLKLHEHDIISLLLNISLLHKCYKFDGVQYFFFKTNVYQTGNF